MPLKRVDAVRTLGGLPSRLSEQTDARSGEWHPLAPHEFPGEAQTVKAHQGQTFYQMFISGTIFLFRGAYTRVAARFEVDENSRMVTTFPDGQTINKRLLTFYATTPNAVGKND